MSHFERTESQTQETVIDLLSDEEIAQVRSCASAVPLNEGDEYLDLAHLAAGVRRTRTQTTLQGRLLPKRAVLPRTWNRILKELAVPLPTHGR